MLIVSPLSFYNKSYTELTFILHLGKNLCGHDGIIHGGLAATILDEVLGGLVSTATKLFIYKLTVIYIGIS
jgi:acyl-coenzyme A thioesterase PaaI-like protein